MAKKFSVNRNKDYENVVKNTSYILSLFVILIVVGMFIISISHELNYSRFESMYSWHYADGSKADMGDLDAYDTIQTVYRSFENAGAGKALMFCSRNMMVDTYIDGVLVDSDERVSRSFLGSSNGVVWHIVNFSGEESYKEVRLDITACYSDSSGFVGLMHYGQPAQIIHELMHDRLLYFVLNIFFVITTIVLIIFYVINRRLFHLGREFFFLALAAFLCSSWCCIETGILQFFIGGGRVLHFLGYICLAAGPMPISIYLRGRVEEKHKKLTYIYSILAHVIFAILLLLHITGIREFHHTTFVTHILLALLLPFTVSVIREYSKLETVGRIKLALYVLIALVVVLMVAGGVRYFQGGYVVYAEYISAGLFFLLLVMLIYQLISVSSVVKKGFESEFLHNQAITDYLTKCLNRTGFAEYRGEYMGYQKPFGVVAIDINNLKKVNDTYGHEAGDALICQIASIMVMSFGHENVRYFRMGGDEFLIILTTEDPKASFEIGLKQMNEYAALASEDDEVQFAISFAAGFAIHNPGEDFTKTLEDADRYMYENKRDMKEGRSGE